MSTNKKQFSDGNMTSILSKLKNEFDNNKSKSVAVTLLASGWSNSQQTVNVPGLGASQNGVICLAQNVTAAEYEAASAAGLFVAGQAGGKLTIGYTGTLPTCNIPATLILLG